MLFEQREPYRTITCHVNANVKHNEFQKVVYKETHEGPMQSFDDAPFEPAFFDFDTILTWLESGGGDEHGYDWELT
jgi:hypothetical protein